MGRVTGIGGFFFRARDPAALGAWYSRNFGIAVETGEGGMPWQQEAGHTVFAPFREDTDYFGDPARQWMLNLRVEGLESLVDRLRNDGVEVTLDPEPYPYGRFARLKDPEGNPLELWEPAHPGATPG